MGGYLSHLKAEPLPGVLNASCGPVKGNCYRHVSISKVEKFSNFIIIRVTKLLMDTLESRMLNLQSENFDSRNQFQQIIGQNQETVLNTDRDVHHLELAMREVSLPKEMFQMRKSV